MASAQCYRSCQESCQQQHGSSLGQKVSEMYKGHNNQTKIHTQQCYSKTQVVSQSSGHHHAAAKTESCGCRQTTQSATSTNTAKCNGGRRSSRGGLLQKIKDGLSGHSSDSSESDSDNEGCPRRRNCN